MQAGQQNPPQGEQAQQAGGVPFEIRYFDQETYMKVFQTHVNVFQLFYSYLTSQGIQVDPNQLSGILNKYWEDYVKTGSSLGSVPEGSTCQHVFTRGASDKVGTMCGTNAKYWGVEGKPKCGSHKNSKASKGVPGQGVEASNKQNSVFNYKEHKNSGVVAAQNLTTLQQSVKKQSSPVQINLSRNEAGIVYNTDTNLVFVQKEDTHYYAVGLLSEDGKSYSKLSKVEIYLCYANGWKWDKDCVEEETETDEHPLRGGLDPNNALVSQQNDVIQSKLNRFNQNN